MEPAPATDEPVDPLDAAWVALAAVYAEAVRETPVRPSPVWPELNPANWPDMWSV